MAALGSQSIASSYEQLLQVDADGGGNGTTHVSVKDGDNGTTFGFTIADDALMMSSTNRLEFGDTGTYIHQSADGVLDLVSDTEIEINATTVDMNGALDVSGATQLNSTLTVGADDAGYDVIFYGDSASSNMTWDTSGDDLILNDARLFINQDDNATALEIDTEATTGIGIFIDTPATTTVPVLKIADCNALTTGNIAYFHSESTSGASRSLVEIHNDSTSATDTVCLKITQDASATNAPAIELTGGGIKFPATQVASGGANTLDDYEEGTWTAAFVAGSGTITINTSFDTGQYVKVGSQITVTGYFNVSSVSSPSGSLQINGLPVAGASSSERSGWAASAIRADGLASGATTSIVGYNDDTATIYLNEYAAGDANNTLAADMESGSSITVNMTYFV